MTRPLGPLTLLPNEANGTSDPWTIGGPRDDDVATVFSCDNATVDITPDEALAYARMFVAGPDLVQVLTRLHTLLTALREDQVSIGMGFGDTQAEKQERARLLGIYVQAHAERVDGALEAAAQVLAKAKGEGA